MMSNVVAAGILVDQLRTAGRLEDVDEARVAGLLSMAAELDSDPGNASLWRAYWQVESLLREDNVDDDAFEALLAGFGEAQVVNKTNSR